MHGGIFLFQPLITGYLMDYKLSYTNYCAMMLLPCLLGDLVSIYVITKFLKVPFAVLMPNLTWSINEEYQQDNYPFQYEVVLGYNK